MRIQFSVLRAAYIRSQLVHSKKRWALMKKQGYTFIGQSLIGHSLTVEGSQLTIADGVFINNDVYIECHAPVTIEPRVSIAPGTKILTGTHEIGFSERRAGAVQHLPVTVGNGTWIGANVTILPGVTIGAGCVIGAGSVVTKDCRGNTLYAGVPARKIRDLGR